MRVLRFSIAGQKLVRGLACDFSNIVGGSKGYLWARFTFPAEWAGFKKVAVFSYKGKEYPVGLDKANSCEIPEEVLAGGNVPVQVYVVGQRDRTRVQTNAVAFKVSR